jgi:hypothetical protein
LNGSKIERKLETWLNQPVSWKGPHVRPGKKWAEIALEREIPGKPMSEM